jgi:fimbrial chaperone protein
MRIPSCFRPAWRSALVVILAAACTVTASADNRPASVMIWPVYPVIRSGDRATALWLENRGSSPVTVQVRVMAWTQHDQADRLLEQHDAVVPSPPMATIDPGRRQLVRLTTLAEPGANLEAAYRVLIDELPRPALERATPPSGQASLGIKVQMRYSLPLFVYGRGFVNPDASDRKAMPADSASLTWRVTEDAGQRWVVVRNTARTHARLSDVRFVAADAAVDVAGGLLGYVLPGAEMRWKMPEGASVGRDASLEARVNGTLRSLTGEMAEPAAP